MTVSARSVSTWDSVHEWKDRPSSMVTRGKADHSITTGDRLIDLLVGKYESSLVSASIFSVRNKVTAGNEKRRVLEVRAEITW